MVRLRENYPLVLDENDLARLRGSRRPGRPQRGGGGLPPLSRLLNFYVGATQELHGVRRLPRRAPREPHSSSGSPARSRSASRRPPASCARCSPAGPTRRASARHDRRFLFPNAELEERGLLQRKGFPESYDRRALLRFVAEVKSGKAEVTAPVYSHLTYDIVPGEQIVVRRPDVLIVEGLNVLQAPEVHPVRGTGWR